MPGYFRDRLVKYCNLAGMMLVEPIGSISSSDPRRNSHQIRFLNGSCRPAHLQKIPDYGGKKGKVQSLQYISYPRRWK